MSESPTKRWFGVRTIYHFGKKKDGTNLFEDRVVVFSAETFDEAMKKADREADDYASANRLQRHPWQVAYAQDDDPLIDGYEVWSEVYEFAGDLESFVKSRYESYEYHPDP